MQYFTQLETLKSLCRRQLHHIIQEESWLTMALRKQTHHGIWQGSWHHVSWKGSWFTVASGKEADLPVTMTIAWLGQERKLTHHFTREGQNTRTSMVSKVDKHMVIWPTGDSKKQTCQSQLTPSSCTKQPACQSQLTSSSCTKQPACQSQLTSSSCTKQPAMDQQQRIMC